MVWPRETTASRLYWHIRVAPASTDVTLTAKHTDVQYNKQHTSTVAKLQHNAIKKGKPPLPASVLKSQFLGAQLGFSRAGVRDFISGRTPSPLTAHLSSHLPYPRNL